MAYLFSAIIANTVLAAIITFAPLGLYPAYLTPTDDLGLLPLIREQWGISPRLDQQLGGLLMWVPGCGVYLWAILAFIVHWLGQSQQTDQPGNAPDGIGSTVVPRRSEFV